MNKRKLLPGGRLVTKKIKHYVPLAGSRLSPEEESITDAMSAIKYIRSVFPVKELGGRFPPIIFKHQLYSLVENRTDVDKEVNVLAEKRQIKIFHLQHHNDESMIILKDDFISYVQNYHGISNTNGSKNSNKVIVSSKDVISRFLAEVVTTISDVSVSEDVLKTKFGFTDSDLTELVNGGLLVLRDTGTWWFSLPSAGQFMKIFQKGRQAALKMIRITKFKEILLSELKSRKPPSSMKLGMLYHTHDLVGSDLVKCIKSSSGHILRLIDD